MATCCDVTNTPLHVGITITHVCCFNRGFVQRVRGNIYQFYIETASAYDIVKRVVVFGLIGSIACFKVIAATFRAVASFLMSKNWES